jgi:hypothetical protein
MQQAFVSREQELSRLDTLLSQAMSGNGQVCFVTGEAGVGKTSLTAEFARRAEDRYAELLIAIGDCNSQTGIGDPYLPFREVLSMLAGDIDDRVAQGMTSEENASRLRGFLGVSKRIIKEVGPDLIDIFVPGVAAMSKAGSMVAGSRSSGRAEAPAEQATLREVAKDRDQGRIFEQVTRVLVTLAAERPLVVILDDLHWIDDSSASLLFHIARRIEGSRILVVGTLRPEEIDIGRGESRHPMSPIVSEVKRHYGDVVIELGLDDESSALTFVEQLLERESIMADSTFRERFVAQTRGHPLFAIELLSDMRERGVLIEQDDGTWVEGPALDWTTLPARTEGVIEERISRLSGELQEILTVASIQGETFTVQIIAAVLDLDERRLLKVLSQELGRVHRLVREEATERIGGKRVSQFRFRHQLFQKYLYDRLGMAERELLHEDIAKAIEELYGERRDSLPVVLAFHFDRANLPGRAAYYYLKAGKRAVAVYAYREAVAHARAGIQILAADADDELALRLDLGLLLGDASLRAGNAVDSMLAFRETAELALQHESQEAAATAAIGYTEPGWRYNAIDATTVDLLRRSLALLDESDSDLRARLLANFARATQETKSDDDSLAMVAEATAMARRLDNPRAVVDCLRIRFNIDREPENIHERLVLADEIRDLTLNLDDKALLMESLAFSVYDRLATGDIASCENSLDEMQAIAAEAADPFYVYHEATMRVALLILRGAFDDAERSAIEAMQAGKELGVTQVDGVMGVQMFTVRREQGRLGQFAPVIRTFLEREGADSAWRPGLALACADVGDLQEARKQFDIIAADNFSAIAQDSLRQTCLCYLAEVCDVLGDAERARELYDMLLPYAELMLVVGNATACLGSTARYLGQLATVMERYEDAEQHFRFADDLNRRTAVTPWLAHGNYEYARMLIRRGATGDRSRALELLADADRTSRELGMAYLLGKVGAVRDTL